MSAPVVGANCTFGDTFNDTAVSVPSWMKIAYYVIGGLFTANAVLVCSTNYWAVSIVVSVVLVAIFAYAVWQLTTNGYYVNKYHCVNDLLGDGVNSVEIDGKPTAQDKINTHFVVIIVLACVVVGILWLLPSGKAGIR